MVVKPSLAQHPMCYRFLSCSFTNWGGTWLILILYLFLGIYLLYLMSTGGDLFLLVGPSPQYQFAFFLESLEPVPASLKFCSFFCVIACFNIQFHSFFKPKFRHFASCCSLQFKLDCGSRGLDLKPSRVIVLCSWAKHFTITRPLSTQEYKWLQVNCQGSLMKCRGGILHDLAFHPGRSGNTPSCLIHKPG